MTPLETEANPNIRVGPLRWGRPTIIVEQNALAVLKYSDRAVILDTGVVVYDGPAKEVLENEDLRNRYLAI
jgi:branched-chain amino acid transport system ATP-binding protein